MCWMPSPLYSRRNSSIWLLSSWLSFERDADLAARAGHRLGEQAGTLALDVEVADLAEVEEPLVEIGPDRHPAAIHVVGQVVDVGELRIARSAIALAASRDGSRNRRRRSSRCRHSGRRRYRREPPMPSIAGMSSSPSPTVDLDVGRAELERAVVRGLGVLDPERHGAGARAVVAGIILGVAAGLGIDDEVAVALRCSVTFLRLCRATSGKPILVNSERSSSMSGAAYSTNSKPSVPIGFSRPNGPFSATCVAMSISFAAQLRLAPAFQARQLHCVTNVHASAGACASWLQRMRIRRRCQAAMADAGL